MGNGSTHPPAKYFHSKPLLSFPYCKSVDVNYNWRFRQTRACPPSCKPESVFLQACLYQWKVLNSNITPIKCISRLHVIQHLSGSLWFSLLSFPNEVNYKSSLNTFIYHCNLLFYSINCLQRSFPVMI